MTVDEEVLAAAAPLIAQRLRGGGSPGKGKGEKAAVRRRPRPPSPVDALFAVQRKKIMPHALGHAMHL